MRPFFAQRTMPSVLFLTGGIFCAAASFLETRINAPSIDIYVPRIYLVIHLHPLELGVFLGVFYAILYYLSARLLNLIVPTSLVLLHFLVTSFALIGLGSLHYVSLGPEPREPLAINPVFAILATNAFSLLVVSGALFVANLSLASLLKRRQAVL
jgi:hypothetical protein